MARRNAVHPKVSIVDPPQAGWPYQLSFKHPLEKQRQIKRSIKTTDGKMALNYAITLSGIIRNPDQWRNLPDTTPKIIEILWKGEHSEIIAKEVATDAFRIAFPEIPKDSKLYFGAGQIHIVPAGSKSPVGADEKSFEEMSAGELLDCLVHFRKTNPLAKAVHDKFKASMDEVMTLRARVQNLKLRLRQLGGDDENVAPQVVTQAIHDFLSDNKAVNGTDSGYRHRLTLRCRLLRFARGLQPEVAANVYEVKPQHVIDHLATVDLGTFVPLPLAVRDLTELEQQTYKTAHKPMADSTRTVGEQVLNFLENRTNGAFRSFPVREWMRKHLKRDSSPKKAPRWLDQNDVDLLLKHMPEYWRDLAEIQWYGGFRPEELVHLQASKVSVKSKDEIRIEVCSIMDGQRTIWKPKTVRSYGNQHVHEDARKTIKRLLKRGKFLLFPNDRAAHRGMDTEWYEGQEFHKSHLLWRVDSFCRQYCRTLREAAKAAGLSEWKRVDSRTMRRSCGKRVLLESNYNIGLTAAILRDTEEIVRDHYAWLLPKDVKQPKSNE